MGRVFEERYDTPGNDDLFSAYEIRQHTWSVASRVLRTRDGDELQRLAYSPRPDDLGDYLVHAALALTTRVWEFLGIKTQISDDYDSTPFVDPDTGEARSRNDLTFITGLNVSF